MHVQNIMASSIFSAASLTVWGFTTYTADLILPTLLTATIHFLSKVCWVSVSTPHSLVDHFLPPYLKRQPHRSARSSSTGTTWGMTHRCCSLRPGDILPIFDYLGAGREPSWFHTNGFETIIKKNPLLELHEIIPPLASSPPPTVRCGGLTTYTAMSPQPSSPQL
ncbi:hypothetical protein LY76DRAFT_7518 [Colletotrichum caudatum]|nr:hypothetical protein LY76DRAFT_7518 [Colletotrichum caudatum]